MTPRLLVLSVISSVAIFALPSSAQNVKPGLWEIKNKVQWGNSQMAQMMAQVEQTMAAMSPEQRRAMEDMVRKNGGLAMPEMKDGAMLVKACISKEMVAQGMVPMEQQGNCTHQRPVISGNTAKMSFSCTNPASSGTGEVTFLSDTAYTMKMNLNAAMNNKQETMRLDATGKWLGADCGNVKPMPIAPAAPAK